MKTSFFKRLANHCQRTQARFGKINLIYADYKSKCYIKIPRKELLLTLVVQICIILD